MRSVRRSLLALVIGCVIPTGCNAIFGIQSGLPTGTSGGSGGAGTGGGIDGGALCPPLPFALRAPDDCDDDGAHDYLNDAENCCTRGRRCVGGTCAGGACAPVSLREIPSGNDVEALGVAVEGHDPGDRVLWSDGLGRHLYASAKEPGGGTAAILELAHFSTMVATDGAYLFWTEFDESTVRRTALQGNALAEDVASGEGHALAGKIVASGGWIYWTTAVPQMPDQEPWEPLTPMRVWAARADEVGQAAIQVAGDSAKYGGVGADATHVYWNEAPIGGTTLVVRRSPLPPGLGAVETLTTVMTAGNGGPGDLVVDDRVYWLSDNTLRVVNKDGTGAGVLAQASYPRGLVVDEAAIYWLDNGGTALRRIRKAGGAPETIAVTDEAQAIAQDCRAVYWTENGKDQRRVRALTK